MTGQPSTQREGLVRPVVSQRDVRPAVWRPAPLGLAVADSHRSWWAETASPSQATGGPVSGRRASRQRHGKELAVASRRTARGARRHLADPRVVAIDLVVAELATVGQHLLSGRSISAWRSATLAWDLRSVALHDAKSDRTAALVSRTWPR